MFAVCEIGPLALPAIASVALLSALNEFPAFAGSEDAAAPFAAAATGELVSLPTPSEDGVSPL